MGLYPFGALLAWYCWIVVLSFGGVDVLLVCCWCGYWALALCILSGILGFKDANSEWLKDERIRISSALSLRYSILKLHAKRDLSSHSHGRIMVRVAIRHFLSQHAFHTNYPSYHLLRDYPQYNYRQVTYFRTKSLLDPSSYCSNCQSLVTSPWLHRPRTL